MNNTRKTNYQYERADIIVKNPRLNGYSRFPGISLRHKLDSPDLYEGSEWWMVYS